MIMICALRISVQQENVSTYKYLVMMETHVLLIPAVPLQVVFTLREIAMTTMLVPMTAVIKKLVVSLLLM
jgi:hypothetical protein